MGFFECCHHCVAPKRYPGCSGKCPEYAKARGEYDEYKAKKKAEESLDINKRYRLRKIRNRQAIRNKELGGYSNL